MIDANLVDHANLSKGWWIPLSGQAAAMLYYYRSFGTLQPCVNSPTWGLRLAEAGGDQACGGPEPGLDCHGRAFGLWHSLHAGDKSVNRQD
jgi:hypothetical protein